MTSDAEIYQGLTQVLQDVFGDPSLVATPELSADQVPGWDSVRMINIILAVEQHFGIRLRSKEIDQLKTVGDLAGLVSTKLAA